MPEGPSAARSPKMFLAFVLSALAGYVDAAGYLALDRIYAANMSGNTVTAALHALSGGDVWSPLTALAAFVVGVVIASAVLEVGRLSHRPLRPALYAFEAVLLLAFMIAASRMLPGPGIQLHGPPRQRPELVALISLAMGMQNASLTKGGGMNVFTTHVTGTMTKSGQSLGEWAVDVKKALGERGDRARAIDVVRGSLGAKKLKTAALFAGLWILFALGGLAGGWAQMTFGTESLIAVVVVLLALTSEEVVRFTLRGRREKEEAPQPDRSRSH